MNSIQVVWSLTLPAQYQWVNVSQHTCPATVHVSNKCWGTFVQKFWVQCKTFVQTRWVRSKNFVQKGSIKGSLLFKYFWCKARLLFKDFGCEARFLFNYEHDGCKARLLFPHFGFKARFLFKHVGCEARLCAQILDKRKTFVQIFWVQSKTFV